jgi:hypothetical protein
MTEHEQRLVRQSKRQRRAITTLMDANERLREDILRKEKELYGLVDTNANLRVERDAADALLGAAMDELHASSGHGR